MKILNFFKSKKVFNTNFSYNNITLFLPIIICGGFFAFTIFMFAFGPYEWHLTNPFKLYTFLIVCLVFLIFGYVLGTRKKIKNTTLGIDLNKLIYISFGISIILYILTLYATTGKIYPDIYTGIFNSGIAYKMSHTNVKDIYKYVVYLSIIFVPLTCFLIPITLLYFKSLKKLAKFLGVLMIVLNLMSGISQGVINSYADIAFKICLILILILFSNINKNSKKVNFSIIIIIISIAFSFLLYYKTVMSNRLLYDANSSIKNESEIKKEQTTEDDIDKTFTSAGQFSQGTIKKKYFLSILPDTIESPLNHLFSYVTHGYKGLSLAMDEKFTSSYGLGFSDFFRHNLLKITGKSDLEKDIYNRTYMSKISKKYKWKTGEVWSSFFLYPASDIGFTFTIILVGIIGYLFAIFWKDLILNKNIFAGVLFYQTTILICFFSANNQLFQGGATFSTIVSLFIIWMIIKIFKKEN